LFPIKYIKKVIVARYTSGKWTAEEDEALKQGIYVYGEKRWSAVSNMLGGRSPIQCLHRWTKILKPGLKKGNWTVEEDEKLTKWVETNGTLNWTQCSKGIEGRNGKQCRERWHNSLCPDIKKGHWGAEEDLMIFNMFQKYGSKWSLFAKNLAGRSENAIKNRFYSTIRKFNHIERLNDCNKRNEETVVGQNKEDQANEVCIYHDEDETKQEKEFEANNNPFLPNPFECQVYGESVCELWS